MREYLASRRGLRSHEALQGLLPASLFERLEIDMCSRHPAYHDIAVMTATDETRSALQIARHLLTASVRPRRR